MARSDWVIERLAKKHDRTNFHCGRPVLDDWLRLRAGQHQKRDLARTYVAVRPGTAAVVAYYAISSHRVHYEALPEEQAKKLPSIDVPVILLARLAVDESYQRQRLGELMLIDALRRSQHIADQIGVRAVEVDAIDENALAFYSRYGFVRLMYDPRHLFLPLQIIRRLNLPPLG